MGQWWESLKTCKWQKWVIAGCQKYSTARNSNDPLWRNVNETPLIRIFWRSWSLWMRPGTRCSIPKQTASQNNGNIHTRHLRKNSELERLQRKFSIQFSGTRRALFSHINSPKGHDNHRRMLDILKNRLLPAVAEKRPELVGNFILHKDNTPPHKARIVIEFLTQQGIETPRHPPYSPDLAPSDFWLTPWNSLSEEDNFLRDQVSVQQFTTL